MANDGSTHARNIRFGCSTKYLRNCEEVAGHDIGRNIEHGLSREGCCRHFAVATLVPAEESRR